MAVCKYRFIITYLFCIVQVVWIPASVLGVDVATFADSLAPIAEIHVATTGSDVSGNGSVAAPYATIGYGISRAVPGTAVRIQPGTYGGGIYSSGVAGTAVAPIWIGGSDPQHPPVISGGGTGIQFSRSAYVILHDLEVTGAASNGINFDDGGDTANPLAAHHLLFQRLFIHDIGGSGNQDALKLSGLRDYFVLDCRMTRNGGGGSGSGIDQVGCHRGMIAGCIFTDLSGNAVQVKGGSEDVEVRWCWIQNAGERGINIGGSTGFQYFRPPLSTTAPNFEAKNIRVLSNVFVGSVTPFAFVGCVNSIAANNTIIDPVNWLFRILQETRSTPEYTFLASGANSLSNNLFYFSRGQIRTHVNIGAYTAPDTFHFSNNLWYAHDNPGASAPSLPAPETNGLYGQNPQLADPGGQDYTITETSPAFQAGLAPVLVQQDMAGQAYLNPPSIGAYETPGRCRGDRNGDGVVDIADLAYLAASFGRTGLVAAGGDMDGDADADGGDLAAFALDLQNPLCTD